MIRAKIKFLLFPLVLLMLLTSLSWARDLTGVTTSWAPHYGESLESGGPLEIITKLVFERAGYRTQIDYISSWNRAVKNVLEGSNDFVMGAYYSEERARDYYITKPIYHIDTGVIALVSLGFEKMDGLASLRPFTIGVNLGYTNTKEFDAANYLKKEAVRTPELNIRKLYRNRVDMIFGAIDVVRYQAEQENLNAEQLVFVQPPLQTNALHLLISRNISEGEKILADFNRGLDEIQKDGTLDQILREHLGRK